MKNCSVHFSGNKIVCRITIVRITILTVVIFYGEDRMKKYQKLKMIAVLLAIDTARTVMQGIREAGELMDMTTIDGIKTMIDVGITPALLLVFVWYFLNKSKGDDKKVQDAFTDAQKKIEETNQIIREREDALLANNARREEMIREDAERRENLIRSEAEKRESILLVNMDRMLDNMNSITRAMNKMENSFNKVEQRLENIEQKIGKEGTA